MLFANKNCKILVLKGDSVVVDVTFYFERLREIQPYKLKKLDLIIFSVSRYVVYTIRIVTFFHL